MKSSLDSGMPAVLRLAWPTVLSFVLNNGFRINDQYWVQGLGPAAQAAIGASTILLILNFAVTFLAVGGSLPLVARASGARDVAQRDGVIRHTFALGLLIAIGLGSAGYALSPQLSRSFGVGEEVSPLMAEYMRTIYLWILPLVLAPILDNLFIAMGNTKLPMLLQVMAVALNLVLNPLLIYGHGSFEGLGISGAAAATGISRGLTVVLGLVFLVRLYGVQLFRGPALRLRQIWNVFVQGLPICLSIAVYAGVYGGLFALVIGDLGRDVVAGFGIGFNAFESVSYPFLLGVAMAGASLVGRNLGAGDERDAWRAVHNTRLVGRLVGLGFALVFFFGGPVIAPWFTDEPGVLSEVIRYVGILAWSQFLVAEEVINEKVLYGAGHARSIVFISTLGNGLRLPLGWYFAAHLGYGAAGLWWVINGTTLLKAVLFHLEVRRGQWVAALA